MLSIRSGFHASTVLDYLNYARSEMTSVSNVSPYMPADALNAYNTWATRQIRTLGSALSEREMSALITSGRYWSLQSVDPSAYGRPLIAVIEQELLERRQALDNAYEELRRDLEAWGNRETVMAVLDTNVLLQHHKELESFKWHDYLNVQADSTVVVWVPVAVVDELDSLKLSRNEMTIGGRKTPVRTLARQALRDLNLLFADSLATDRFQSDGPTQIRLLLDADGRERLPTVDAEIIDRAVGLSAYAWKTFLVTYDLGMVFSARTQSLQAVRLEEDVPEEDELGPYPVKPPRHGG